MAAESSSLLPTESEATYHTFTAEVFSDLNPKTPVQYLLVERESTSRRNEAPPAAPDLDPVEDHSAPHTLAHYFPAATRPPTPPSPSTATSAPSNAASTDA